MVDYLNIHPPLHGVLLASGESSRMGRCKLLFPWRNTTIIEHLLDKLSCIPVQGFSIVIAANNHQLKCVVEPFQHPIIYNSTPSKGMGYSIFLAIQSLPPDTEGVMILLADQPEMDSKDVIEVVCLFSKTYYGSPLIIQTVYLNGKPGHPVLFSKHFFPELARLHEDGGGKHIIKQNQKFVKLHHSSNRYPDDVDTPEDYARLL
jgi:molybdenum cofactor cytidylyltransferase